jgi:hypothetical protein
MKALLVLLVSSLALGCAEQREYTFTEIKAVPKTAKKTTVKSKHVTVVGKDGKRTDNQIVIYDVGTTVNSEGDLVGPHKVYRVVETSHWILGKPKIVQPKTFVKDTPKDEPDKVTVKEEPKKDQAADLQTAVATQADPTPVDAIRQQIQDGMAFPTPTPDADQEALRQFTKSTADPKNP